MKTRNTINIKTMISPARFEEAMAQYAEAERREAEINSQIEGEVNELLDKYRDELACIAQGRQIAFDTVHAYCLDNKESLFGRRRSIATLHGIAGFRLGTPRLKLEKNSSWINVLATLREKLPGYVRTTEEPARDLLLTHRHREEVAPVLVEMGVHIVQDELFYIEAKKAA